MNVTESVVLCGYFIYFFILCNCILSAVSHFKISCKCIKIHTLDIRLAILYEIFCSRWKVPDWKWINIGNFYFWIYKIRRSFHIDASNDGVIRNIYAIMKKCSIHEGLILCQRNIPFATLFQSIYVIEFCFPENLKNSLSILLSLFLFTKLYLFLIY